MTKLVASIQGIYYVAAGLWPLLSMVTFEAVSGPKDDEWLVNTVGILVTVIGLVLILAAIRNQISAAVCVLAIASAMGLAFVDFYYAMRGVIWPIYMLDGAGEVALIAWWIIAMYRDRAVIAEQTETPHMSGSKS